MFIPLRAVVLLSLASATPVLAQPGARPCPRERLHYDVALQAGSVRVDLCVPATDADSVGFALREWGGVETFADNVTEIAATAADGAVLPVERRGTDRWMVRSGARRAFRVAYTIRHDKPSFMGTEEGGHFQPTLFPDWALLWGPSYLVRPMTDALTEIPAGVRIDAGPYRTAYPSWGADTVAADVDALRNSVLAAGNYRRETRQVQGVPVTFLAQGAWSFTDEAFAAVVERVLQAQAAAMGSYPARRLTVLLLPGLPNNAGGTVVKDAMAVYPSPEGDVLRDPRALGLIAHEHFHLWNGEAATAADDVPEGAIKWFSEGFTDYYADLTLLRAGVLDEAGLIARTNDRIRDYLANPHARTATSAILGEKYWESQEYNRLPYVKGALTALLMDLRIRRASGGTRSLDDFTRAVFARGGTYRTEDLRRMLEGTAGGDWGAFFAAYVDGAQELPILEICAEAGMECAPGPVPLFHLGFGVEGGMRRDAAVASVDAGSAAERAGLRAGDVLRGFSIRRDPAVPAQLEVERGGERITLTYLPAREIIAPSILSTDASRRVVATLRGGSGQTR
ncbi:MAG TPA: hypothetical protein VF665_15110 [Longimicrobium sp.]|uniref:M61 family metallopeptidase n=1 Tax=Longimicrobium sp. TaxID=2029185 RepID=UPI002EDBAEA0